MAVTTWTFATNFEGWSFAEGPSATAGSTASAIHVTGAVQISVGVPVSPPSTRNAQGDLTSMELNAIVANLDTIELDFSAVTGTDNQTTLRVRAIYTDATTENALASDVSGPGTVTLTLTQNKTLESILVRSGIEEGGGARTETVDFEEVRLTTATPFVGTGERPLELDIDLAEGSKIWTTKWDAGGLYLVEHSDDLILQNTFAIATGTTTSVTDITNRTFYMTPYAPPFFGTASLDDIIYIYGRWDDSGVEHLAKSTDGGASFTDIGDSATWLAGWVGGFFADDANILFAFVNGSSRAIYRSTNAGSSWTNLSTLPFDVDPGGMSKHPDGRILISNRDAGAQTAAYAEAPDYPTWIDATGSPSFPTSTPGNGSNAIIWIT